MRRQAFSLDEANALIPDLVRQFEELRVLPQQAEAREEQLEKLVELDRSNGRNHGDEIARIENEIEGIKINGVDIITFSDDGKITHFKVMVRPLKAINLLHRMMGEELMKQSGATSQSQSR